MRAHTPNTSTDSQLMEQDLALKKTVDDPQVGCNLTPDEGDQLTLYARQHELSRPNLCGLLVVRELKLKRLAALKRSYGGSGSRKGGARVTARVSRPIKAEFMIHVADVPMGADDAAAILFRAELSECWLSKAVSDQGNRP